MGPRSIIGFAVGSLAVAVVVFFLLHQREVRHEEAVGRETDAKAMALKADIEANFSVGASEADVRRFLQARDPRVTSGKNGDLVVWVGKRPSGVWYCGPVSVGVFVLLHDGRLVAVRIDGRADNCL